MKEFRKTFLTIFADYEGHFYAHSTTKTVGHFLTYSTTKIFLFDLLSEKVFARAYVDYEEKHSEVDAWFESLEIAKAIPDPTSGLAKPKRL